MSIKFSIPYRINSFCQKYLNILIIIAKYTLYNFFNRQFYINIILIKISLKFFNIPSKALNFRIQVIVKIIKICIIVIDIWLYLCLRLFE